MPHFRISVSPPAITITGAALGDGVHPSLKMARAALEIEVAREIDATNETLGLDIDRLKLAAREKIRDLRASRDAALKVREADLPSDDASPSAPPGIPLPAPPIPQAPAEVAEQAGAASDDPFAIPPALQRPVSVKGAA